MRQRLRAHRFAIRVALIACASMPLTIAIGADMIERGILAGSTRPLRPEERARRHRIAVADAARAPIAPMITTVTDRLARALPRETSLAEIAAEPGGRVTFAIDTNDPDALRPLIRSVPALRAFRQIDQAPSGAGVRIVFAGHER